MGNRNNMFVRKTKKPNDRISIRIVENYRDGGKVKQRTITGIGTAHKDDTKRIEHLIRVANEMIVKIKNDITPALPGLEEATYAPQKKEEKKTVVAIEDLVEEKRITTGIDEIFNEVFQQMDLLNSINTGYKQEEVNELFQRCVIERVENPVSKRQSVKNMHTKKGISIDLDKVYRMMDKVYKNKDRIKKKISDVTINLFNQKVDVAFFDVTTLYFESFIPDDLKSSGFSKDGKFKETQIMLSLITTTDGLPLGYEIFPGNSYEGNTLITVIEEVEKNYNLSNTFVVADRAMFTETNLKKLEQKNVKFIVAAKLKTMKKEKKNQILNDFEELRKQYPKEDFLLKEYTHNKRRLIVSYSKKRAAKDKKDRERLVERIKKKMKGEKVLLADLINNTGTKKYLDIEKKSETKKKNCSTTAILSHKKIEAHERWDGIHAVITSDSGQEYSATEILDRYRNLWQIEAAFRINKHDLKMRPIYHWTPKRIHAHILICFVAYSLVAFAKYKLKKHQVKLSFQQIREELEQVQYSVVRDKVNNQKFLIPSALTKNQQKIFKAFGLKLASTPKIL